MTYWFLLYYFKSTVFRTKIYARATVFCLCLICFMFFWIKHFKAYAVKKMFF